MGWSIKCHKDSCTEQTRAYNIVDLIQNHRGKDGWIKCNCGITGYIEKSFRLQEVGDVWEPYLRGIITLGKKGETYQPFVYIVSYTPKGRCTDIWFSYYKDLREQGGKLKLGYGPGGPPVLHKTKIKHLIKILKEVGYFTDKDIKELVDNN